MKLKPIILASTAALYGVGLGAASSAPAANHSGWKPVSITAEQNAERQKTVMQRGPQVDATNPRLQKSAVNRILQRLKPEDKFTPEANISGEQVYIIQLKDSPVATYMGGVKGFASTALGTSQSVQTKPGGLMINKAAASSQKLFKASIASNTDIQKYRGYLQEKQNQFVTEASKFGVDLKIRSHFSVTLNAITAELTQDQAQQLARSNQVIKIERSIVHELDTDVGPQYINADSVWDGSGSQDGSPYKGEGQIIGMIDTGINTDHVSFADVGDDGYDHTNPLGAGNYLGQCADDAFADRCNDKLIGVYTWDVISDMYSAIYFQDGYPDDPPRYEWDYQQIRPVFGEDYNGHGSHTSSTAAGNVVAAAPLQFASYNMDPNTLGASGDGRDTGLTRPVSGVAPHANIIMYQACWAGDGQTSPYYGCPTEATLASIEQAVIDGVDVINYSISGWGFPWDNAIEQAFYSAYAAGISVAASAGNSGFNQPTNHPSPWLLNVAATYHDRQFGVDPKILQSMSGGDTTPPADIEGASISGGITGEIVLAENYGDKTCDTVWPAATFTANQIVVCERSDQPRMDKAQHLVDAGAGGFILYNKDSWGDQGSVVQDMYPLPSIHIDYYAAYDSWKNNYSGLLTWLSTGTGHMGTITAAAAYAQDDPHDTIRIASFTSAAENPDFDGTLTPSIAAPGVDVLAAYSDDQPFTAYPQAMDWNVISGTSMASPHIAGALALIRQAHPEWSVSEVQSAAQMTANTNMDDGSGSDPFFRGGSGLIDVSAAVNAGFVLDENAENMRLANPHNGGDPATLNLPALVNTRCQTTCSWIRTVKATKDGSWTVSAAPNHDAVSISIEAQPTQFSLKAGESRSIVVSAKILDAAARVGSTEAAYLYGDVKFSAVEDGVPDAHWPVKMRFSRNDLPKLLSVEAHRDNGKYTLKNVPAAKVTDFTGRAFEAVEVNDTEIELDQDDDWTNPAFDTDFNGAVLQWIDVPAGATRLFAQTLERLGTSSAVSWQAGDLDVMIGQDLNGNDAIDFDDEAICWSYSAVEKDYCSLNKPSPGRYWIIFYNYKNGFEPISDKYRISWGVVGSEVASNITVTSATEVDASTSKVDLDIEWDWDNSAQGDFLFSTIDLGTSETDAGNLGVIPLNLKRGIDDVSVKGSQQQVRAGDIVDMTVHVLPNVDGADRNFTISTTIPEGLSIVAGSAMVNNNANISAEVMVDGNLLTVSGSQADSANWPRHYNITTNQTNAMCKMPLSEDGGYLDLAELGFSPSFGGHWDERTRFRFRDFFNTEDTYFAPYENAETMKYESINISAQGWVQFDDMPQFWADAYPFNPDYMWLGGIPDTMIAPLFRGGAFDGALGAPYNNPPWWDTSSEPSGVTVAYNDSPKALLIEWDNATTESATWNNTTGEIDWVSWNDSYDFESYIALEYDYGDNKPEIVMAYDNLTFADPNNLPVTPFLMGVNDASIGVYGFWGPRDTFAPTYGLLADQFAFGDIDQNLSNGLVVCYDYSGPEASQFDVTFQLQADNNATGREMMIDINSDVEGIASTTTSYKLTSPSNIQLGAMSDQTTEEDTAIEGIEVLYNDSDPVSNTITASGEHVTVTVNGNESGSTIDIMPDANWYGDTTITVTVADNSYPSDAATTTFNLSVNSDDLKAGCMDSSAENYDADAGEDDNSCKYAPPAEEPQSDSGGGGSFGVAALLMFLLAGTRRRRN